MTIAIVLGLSITVGAIFFGWYGFIYYPEMHNDEVQYSIYVDEAKGYAKTYDEINDQMNIRFSKDRQHELHILELKDLRNIRFPTRKESEMLQSFDADILELREYERKIKEISSSIFISADIRNEISRKFESKYGRQPRYIKPEHR